MSKESPHVLHFFKTYYPDSFGGTEQVIFQLCKGTAHFGFTSEVLTLSPNPHKDPIAFSGHLVHQAKLDFEISSMGVSLSVIQKFATLAKQADIIHLHYPWPFMDMVHFATAHGKPTVLTYHSDIIRQRMLLRLYRPLKNRFLSSVDRIVATSPNYLESSPVLNRYRDKVVEITYGLDKSTYPTPSPDRLAHWSSKFGGRFFLFVGMLRYYKGLHILLDAIVGTNYPVVIVGSGPVETNLKEQANRLNLNNVYFLGALPDEDKVALLQLCYAFVFPSHLRSEAFGISLLEGAMYAKPMISCEISTGTSYINVNGETGLVVQPDNPVEFRNAMKFLWDNPSIAADMGKRAEQRYWALFTSDKMAANYANLYKELLEKDSVAINPIKTRPIAVVGASCLVGKLLLPMLMQSGRQIIAYSRTPKTKQNVRSVEWRELSAQSEINENEIIRDWIWLAPIKILPEHLELMRRAGAKNIVAVSTTSRFTKIASSNDQERKFVEDLISSEEKLQQWSKENGATWTVLRPTLIYGLGLDNNISVIAKFISRYHFFPILGKANGLRQPIHVIDVAVACKAALESADAKNRAYNISGAEKLSYRTMVERIFEAQSKKPRFLSIPLWVFAAAVAVARVLPPFPSWSTAMAERMNLDMVFDNEDAKRDFGFKPSEFVLKQEDIS